MQAAEDCTSTGRRLKINVTDLTLRYEGSSFAATLGGLSALRLQVKVEPQRLQSASAATQQWTEYLQGLVNSYNSCAISRQQYANALDKIYPQLQTDTHDLEMLRKLVLNGQKVDSQKLDRTLDAFMKALRQFADIGGTKSQLEAVLASTTRIEQDTNQILACIMHEGLR